MRMPEVQRYVAIIQAREHSCMRCSIGCPWQIVCASKFLIIVVFADVPLQCACVFVVNKNRDIYSIEIYKRFKILNQRARRAIHCEHLAM